MGRSLCHEVFVNTHWSPLVIRRIQTLRAFRRADLCCLCVFGWHFNRWGLGRRAGLLGRLGSLGCYTKLQTRCCLLLAACCFVEG